MNKRDNGINQVISTIVFKAVVFVDGVRDTIKANSMEDLEHEIEKARSGSVSFAVISRG